MTPPISRFCRSDCADTNDGSTAPGNVVGAICVGQSEARSFALRAEGDSLLLRAAIWLMLLGVMLGIAIRA
jgi:hypothetical protein